jgi:SAM-dependent methyltransferase
MSSRLAYLRLVAGCVVPHTIVEVVRAKRKRQRDAMEGQRTEAIKEALRKKGRRPPTPYSWSDALDFLAALNCDRSDVIAGSIPERSLDYCCRELEQRIKARPVVGLHIGNFVGVSLCHITDFVRRLDERSTIVSVDPNLYPRGIKNPLEKVISCLNRYDLQSNSLILTGYSLEKSTSNAPDPDATFDQEFSCENQLPQLARLMPECFDFAVIDGNHDDEYLTREIVAIDRVLKPGGLLVFDDVNWGSVGGVYQTLDPHGHERLATDGRIGLVMKR